MSCTCNNHWLKLTPFTPQPSGLLVTMATSLTDLQVISVFHGSSICRIRTSPCSLYIMGNSMGADIHHMEISIPYPSNLRSQSSRRLWPLSFTQNGYASHVLIMARSFSPPICPPHICGQDKSWGCNKCYVTTCSFRASSYKTCR